MKGIGSTGLAYLWGKIKAALGVKEDKTTIVNHGTSDTTFALTPNVLHTWGTVNSLTLTLASGSSTYVDGYWFRFTSGSTPTVLTLPSDVQWYYDEIEIEADKTYEVMIIDGYASYTNYVRPDSYATKTWVGQQGYSKDVDIVAASGTTLTCALNKMYVFSSAVTTLAITLPSVEDATIVQFISFTLTTGSSPSITFTSADSSTIMYMGDFDLEDATTYELNAMYNGTMWIVAHATLVTLE